MIFTTLKIIGTLACYLTAFWLSNSFIPNFDIPIFFDVLLVLLSTTGLQVQQYYWRWHEENQREYYLTHSSTPNCFLASRAFSSLLTSCSLDTRAISERMATYDKPEHCISLDGKALDTAVREMDLALARVQCQRPQHFGHLYWKELWREG